MGFFKTEEVTVPLRFLLLTSHFVMVLATYLNRDNIAEKITSDPSEEGGVSSTINILSYVAFACFGIEYISVFLGVSLFIRGQMLLNLLTHLLGLIFMIVFYRSHFNVHTFIAFTTMFSIFPMIIELLTFLSTTCFSYVPFLSR